MLTFAMKLRALRNLLNMSQAELGRRSGIGQWAVSSYERGLEPQEKHIRPLDAIITEEAARQMVKLPFALVEKTSKRDCVAA